LEPADTTSAAVILTVTWVELTTVVVRAAPSHCTVAPETKFVPFTVSVKAAPPVTVVAGDNEVTVGTGFGGMLLLIVKAEELEVLPLLVTVTCAVPEVAISAAAMPAVNCVALTKLVVRADPFHCTVAPFENPVPFTVRVKAADPAVALPGESEVIVGVGDPSLHPVRVARKEKTSSTEPKQRGRNMGPRNLS